MIAPNLKSIAEWIRDHELDTHPALQGIDLEQIASVGVERPAEEIPGIMCGYRRFQPGPDLLVTFRLHNGKNVAINIPNPTYHPYTPTAEELNYIRMVARNDMEALREL